MDSWQNENNDWDDIMQLVDRFNKMLSHDKQAYFDTDEFESLIDFFIAHFAYSKCEQVINYALKQYPNNISFLLRKASIYSITSRENQAINLLKRIEKIDTINPDIYSTKASAFSSLGQYQSAVNEYHKALKFTDCDIDKSEIYIYLADAYHFLKDKDSAFTNLMNAILLNPDNDFAVTKLLLICEADNDFAQAIEVMKDFIDEHPYSQVAWYGLGRLYMDISSNTKAIDAFDYALAIKPDYNMAYFLKAKCNSNLGKYSEAIAIYKEMNEIEPSNDGVTFNCIGECLENLNQSDEARCFFKKALEIDYFNTDALINLSYNYLDAEEPKKAIELISKADEDIINFPELLFIKAQALSDLKKYDEAIENFKILIDLDFDDFNVWIDYADVVEAYKGSEAAEKILEQAIKAYPDCSSLQYRIAACKYKSDKILQALLCLYKAMNTDFTDLDLFFEYMPELKESKDILRLIEIINKIK